MKSLITVACFFAFVAIHSSAFAENGPGNNGQLQSPECLSNGKALPTNNAEVASWAKTKENFHSRAHITGTYLGVALRNVGLTPVNPNHPDADLSKIVPTARVRVPSEKGDSIVDVYLNKDFGGIPFRELKPGMRVEACGTFLMGNSGQVPLLHWVHASPRPDKQDSGFVSIGSKVYGQPSITDSTQSLAKAASEMNNTTAEMSKAVKEMTSATAQLQNDMKVFNGSDKATVPSNGYSDESRGSSSSAASAQ